MNYNAAKQVEFVLSPGLAGVLEPDQYEHVQERLKRIDCYTTGEVIEDYAVGDERIEIYRRDQVQTALDHHVVRYVQRLNLNGRGDSSSGSSLGIYSEQFSSLAEMPTFENYVEAFLKQGFCCSAALKGSDNMGDAILFELDALLAELEVSDVVLPRVTLGSEIQDYFSRSKQLGKIATHAHEGIMGRMILGAAYYSTLEELLANAKECIDVTMFYASSGDDGHPTTKILNKLIELSKGGVRVRVILDKDRKNEIYQSHIINANAYSLLKQGGVDVRWDTISSLTHSKIIIVDGAWVLTGSHNWTASSFFKYHEVSVLLKDKRIASHYQADFDARFVR